MVWRKSTYRVMALERKSAHFLDLLARKDRTVERMEKVHHEHEATLVAVSDALERRSIPHTSCDRTAMPDPSPFDLVVTIGGDGTFLAASHRVGSSPVLGVVSSEASVGHFCAGRGEDFHRILDDLLEDRLRPIALQRIEVRLGGRPARELVLNEILFCHANPAATSRYIIRVGDLEEEQKSSGLWIATAAGSTGAIGSAGGRVLRPTSRRIQYLVREPFYPARRGYRLSRGSLDTAPIELASKMEDGRVYVDGPHITYPVPFGERVTIRRADTPLTVYGMKLGRSG